MDTDIQNQVRWRVPRETKGEIYKRQKEDMREIEQESARARERERKRERETVTDKNELREE